MMCAVKSEGYDYLTCPMTLGCSLRKLPGLKRSDWENNQHLQSLKPENKKNHTFGALGSSNWYKNSRNFGALHEKMGYNFFEPISSSLGARSAEWFAEYSASKTNEWKLENKLPAAEFFIGVYESQRSSSSTWRQFNLDKGIPDYLD